MSPGDQKLGTVGLGKSEGTPEVFVTLTIAFIAVVVALYLPSGMAQALSRSRPVVHSPNENADLDIALSYERARDYQNAATYFASAAKNEKTRTLALAGLARVESALQAAQKDKDAQALDLGDLYASRHLWPKAEDSYKAALGSRSDEIRKKALEKLADVTREQSPSRGGEFLEFFKSAAEFLAIAIALALAAGYLWIFTKRRRSIHLSPFAAPTDELAKKVAFSISSARAQLQDPKSSPTVSLPASLLVTLPTFDDELPEIEDLEIAGVKLPFAALASVFGSAATEVTGGYDGDTPTGYGYALIKSRRRKTAEMLRWPVRANSQPDLMDFAYHILIETISTHADE